MLKLTKPVFINSMRYIIISLLILILFNSNLQSQLKEMKYSVIECPKGWIVGGTQMPILYIETNIENLEFVSTRDGKLKAKEGLLGKGILRVELKDKGKQTIVISYKEYKSLNIKIDEMNEGECKGYKIEDAAGAIIKKKNYSFKINTDEDPAIIKFISFYKAPIDATPYEGSLPNEPINILVGKEDFRDTILTIYPSEKENSKTISLTPSIGYFDFDKKSSELLSLFKPNILDSNLINIELKPSNKLKEGKYKFELNSKIIQPIEFVITNAFIKEKPLKFEDIRKIYLSILKFNISPRGAMEIKLTKDKIPFNLENSKEYLLPNGSYSVIINPENKDYKGYSGTLILENDLSDYKINLPSDIAFIEFDEAFGNNLPTFKGINILTEKTLWQKIFGGKIYKNKTSLGLTTITYNGNNLTRDITSDYNENNPLRIFTNDFQKTGNLLLTTDIVTNFRLINTYSNIEVKQTITDDAFFTVSPGKYYLELNHSELNKSSYILDVNSEENKSLFLTMKPKYSNAMYNNIYPGFGQIYKSHNTRGIIYSSIFSLSLITSYYLFSEYDSEMSNYNWTKNMYLSKVKAEEVTEWNKKLNTQFDKTNTLNNLLKLSLITVATSITFSWLDNIFWEPKFGWRDKDQTKIEVGTKEYLENFYFYLKYAFN